METKPKVVPVINRTIWMVLLGVLVVENLFLAITSEPTPTKAVKKSRPNLDINATIEAGYPRVLCSASKEVEGVKQLAGMRVYNAKEYTFIPDMYDDTHFLIASEINGTIDVQNTFSTSRCAIQ